MNRGVGLRRFAQVLLPLLIIGFSAWALWRQCSSMDLDALRLALMKIRDGQMLFAVGCTALSFVGLAWVEVWAVRKQAGTSVPMRTAALAGSASHAVCHVLGWHAVLGSLLRGRAYSGYGVRPVQILAILVSVGLVVLAGSVGIFLTALAAWHSMDLMVVLLVLVGAVILALSSTAPRNRVHGGGRTAWLALHARRVAVMLPVATLEAAACVATLWVLLPPGTFASWPVFVLTCIAAQAFGVASHAPGGLGVFEAAMLASVATGSRPGLLAAILAYRAIYGLVPFTLLGLPWLAWIMVTRPASIEPVQFDDG